MNSKHDTQPSSSIHIDEVESKATTGSSAVSIAATNQDADEAFQNFYLRQATQEFANDLDKLRTANDFSEQSIPLLVAALNQGSACFSPGDRARVGQAGAQ